LETYSGKFIFECRWQHIWEQLEGNGKEELHERYNDEYRERNETEDVLRCPFQLAASSA
jgi:hypothetical protein